MAVGADLAVVVVGCTKADEGEFIDVGTSESMMTMFPPAPPPPGSGSAAPSGSGIASPDVAVDEPVVEAEHGPASEPAPDMFAPGGDRRSLRLTASDEALVRATVSACPRTVVAVMGGSAVVMPWLEEVPATVQVWYPGMEGGAAFGDVLTGAAEPGGRLPFALPRDESDLVDFDPDADAVVYDLFHGQWKLDRDDVVAHRPLGAGLGYTTFEVDPASMVLSTDGPGATSGVVEVALSNTGHRSGGTVVFLFAGLPGSTVDRPVRRMLAFARIVLDAGATGTVALRYDLADLRVRRNGTWVQEPGRYLLEVGADAATMAVSATVDLAGPR